MKKLMYLAILFVVLVGFSACSLENVLDSGHHNNDIVINNSETPACVQDFVSTHFNGVAITKVKVDYNEYDYYDVRLANGFELEFSQDCEWLDVDGNRNAVPQSIVSLLPNWITQYITTNYPNREVRSISKERYGYEVELRGDVELKCYTSNESIRVDR